MIEEEYDEWAEEIVFTGGEPTMHPDLVECVKHAKKTGYKFFHLQTNGRTLADEDFVAKLVDAGINIFNPALHWFKAETHDYLVGAEGAWKQVVEGIQNVRKYNVKISTNTVVTTYNYKELPKIALLFIKLWVNQFQYAFPHITGSAEVNKKKIVPRKTDVLPFIKRWLDLWKKHWIYCMTEAIPYCLMWGYEWAIAENYMPETTILDANNRLEDYTEYRLNDGKSKRQECKYCKFNNRCEGPWKEYPDLYGWDEFLPQLYNN